MSNYRVSREHYSCLQLDLTCSFLISSAFDVDLFLSLCLGDKRHPYKYLIPLTVVNCLMFVTGTIGNVLSKHLQQFRFQ